MGELLLQPLLALLYREKSGPKEVSLVSKVVYFWLQVKLNNRVGAFLLARFDLMCEYCLERNCG